MPHRGWKHGEGVETDKRGTYDGSWRIDKYHGCGTYTFSNGAEYEGSYDKGFRSGDGTFTYADGSRYEGKWHLGVRHGPGVLVGADGSRTAQVHAWEDYLLPPIVTLHRAAHEPHLQCAVCLKSTEETNALQMEFRGAMYACATVKHLFCRDCSKKLYERGASCSGSNEDEDAEEDDDSREGESNICPVCKACPLRRYGEKSDENE